MDKKKKRVVRQKAKGPIDPTVGENVRKLRIEKGMTQAQLAGSDFSKGFISLLETGRTRASLRAAEILAKRLGITAPKLLTLKEFPRLEGLPDIAARITAIANASHDAGTIIQLRHLAEEVTELTKRRMISADARFTVGSQKPWACLKSSLRRPHRSKKRELQRNGAGPTSPAPRARSIIYSRAF